MNFAPVTRFYSAEVENSEARVEFRQRERAEKYVRTNTLDRCPLHVLETIEVEATRHAQNEQLRGLAIAERAAWRMYEATTPGRAAPELSVWIVAQQELRGFLATLGET